MSIFCGHYVYETYRSTKVLRQAILIIEGAFLLCVLVIFRDLSVARSTTE